MKEILVDTNVLISFLTDRNKSQQEQAAALFRGAADREHTLVLHSITLVEMTAVFTLVAGTVLALSSLLPFTAGRPLALVITIAVVLFVVRLVSGRRVV